MHAQDKKLTTYINPYSYLVLRRSGLLKKVSENFNIEYDGISILTLHNLTSSQIKSRRSFDDTSVAPEVFTLASKQSKRIGLLGSLPDTIHKAEELINKKYGPIVSWSHCGYFTTDKESEVIQAASGCDIIICSMGTPKQEDFLLKLQTSGWSGIGYTCGGYFDQLTLSNGHNYYPNAINKLNLRWAYRIYKEPGRLWRRYLLDYPKGLCFFIIDRILRAAS